jgi:hypothetical protein
MSFLKTSLEKRIKELRASIELQKTELAAYEQVLALESGKPIESVSESSSAPPAKTKNIPVAQPIEVEFNGSRSDFVASVVKAKGSAGVTPQEIAAAFAARKIAVGKNLVYNALSLMYKQKKVRKSDGRYFATGANATASAGPAKKRRISEEGMKRIIAATKKRWALARAAKAKSR